MRSHIGRRPLRSGHAGRRRWEVLAAASAVLTSSLALIVTTATTSSAADDCARRYVAQGDGVVFGTHIGNSFGGASESDRYPEQLLNDHLKTIPGGTGPAPWCLDNTATDPATGETFVQGSGSQQAQAWNLKPSLITLQLGRQNATIVDQIGKCFDLIEQWNLLPAGATCANGVFNDANAWSKLQKDLSGILNTYKTQMSGNPNLVAAILGYYNPYPPMTAVLKVPRLCIRLIDSAIPCGLYWAISLPLALKALDDVVKKLNTTISNTVRPFITASQGRFFFVNPYDKFKRHCAQMNVVLSTPLVWHPPAVFDSHWSNALMGCRDNWVAWDGSLGVSPVVYLWPVAPPGIPLIPPFHITQGMGFNPNKQGHECLSDLIWETVKNKLGVPERADIQGACSSGLLPSDPPAEDPPPTETNPNAAVAPASAVVQGHITAGLRHSCAVVAGGGETGPVQCWGNNDYGQLGDGTTRASSQPVAVSGISNARAVSAGTTHTCALRADGTVWCWGSDTSSELGDGGTASRTTPVQAVGVTGATAVVAGAGFSCAIVSGGTVKCWGDDSGGQLGDGTPGDPTRVPALVRGITTANPAVAITAGDYHACALLADKKTMCWGNNESGQLGDRFTVDRAAPVPVVGLPDPAVNPPTALSAGSAHTCALLKDNSARCWGDNTSGQLGYETPVDEEGVRKPSPVPDAVRYDADPGPVENPQPLYGLTALSAGHWHTCGLMSNGTGRCWGDNSSGELGHADSSDHSHGVGHPEAVVVSGLSGASGVTAGGPHNCAIVGSGVSCWGANSDSQLGHTAPFSPTPVRVKGVSEADVATTGTGFVCALVDRDTANKPVCWGDNSSGQLGASPPPTASGVPIAVDGIPSADAIDAGNGHACAVPAGTTSARCWGRSADGQLGDSTTGNGPVGPAVSAGGGRGTDGAERGHTCAVRPDSTVACWGRNAESQLGDGTTTDRSSPVTVQVDTDADPGPDHVVLQNMTGVTQVATGGFHSCALRTDGTTWCWGRNDYGQLGDNTVETRSVATQVQMLSPTETDPEHTAPLTGVVTLAAGANFTCGVVTHAPTPPRPDAGGVKCWGANDRGQLGDGTAVARDLPVAVSGVGGVTGASPAKSITAGDVHVCIRLDDDSVLCWGGNSSGQLGDGSTIDRRSPALILAPPPAGTEARIANERENLAQQGIDTPAVSRPFVRSISASRSNTCVTQVDRMVTCWGDNSHRQLVDGLGDASATPLRVDLTGSI